MQLELHRFKEGAKATLGNLFVDGVFECHTLEDVVRDLGPNGEGKVWGATAIPAGTYDIVLTMSPKFGRIMPRLVNVPFFTGILMHKGNTDKNTEGCILVANNIAGDDLVTDATGAFDAFYPKLEAAAVKGEKISITITNDFKGPAAPLPPPSSASV